jgi:hypothetical protein
MLGASFGSTGMTATLADETLLPKAFAVFTVQVYVNRLVKPVTVMGETLPTTPA